jgi:hypothetical protein
MPQVYKSMGPSPGSRAPSENRNLPPTPGLLTKSKQGSLPSEPDRPAAEPPPSSDLSCPDLEATEPFPPGLFRMPVPNRLFSDMPRLGDAALRCLLGLFRLSFRFDPGESQWTCPRTWLLRRDLQKETGLSDQGTRRGLSELTENGWAEADRSGQAYQWRLRASVPTKRFTYVPTSLLSRASELPTGASLRTALAVLRETWGWTHPRESASTGPTETPESTGEQSSHRDASCVDASHGTSCRDASCRDASYGDADHPGGGEENGREHVHQKWARLSHRDLASATGRSETAVKEAAKALQGRWLCRRRPGHGAFYYRIRPEALAPGPSPGSTSGSREEPRKSPREEGRASPDSASEIPSPTTGAANELGGGSPTDWYPPPFIRDSLERDKHSAPASPDTSSEKTSRVDRRNERSSAMLGDNNSSRDAPPSKEAPPDGPEQQRSSSDSPDFSAFPEEKQALGQKLINAGIWPGRAHECLRRYSTARVAANFDLWRTRKNDSGAPEIENDGAWLCMAITDGYANASHKRSCPERSSPECPSSEQRSSQGSSPNPTSLQPNGPGAEGQSEEVSPPPEPSHKQRVSPREKAALIRQYEEITSGQFYRFRHMESSTKKQFLYFDPSVGEPDRRGPKAENTSGTRNGDPRHGKPQSP